jgi:pimeloyl-ACP methyl ester carboxylesterase
VHSYPLKSAQKLALALAVVALYAGIATKPAVAQAAKKTTGYATAPDGVRIAYDAYETNGAGKPALVFVHGWSCDRSYWKNQLEPFSRQFRIVTVDLAGHGESGIGRKDWTIASFGGDVAAVVKKLGLDRVILIGHSMGGDVIAEAARQLPTGRVTGMIWLDTYKQLGAGRNPEQVSAFVSRLRANFRDSTRAFVHGLVLPTFDPSLVEWVANDMSSAPPDIALAAIYDSFNYSRVMPHTLQALKLPVIAINPDNAPTDTASLRRYGVDVMIIPGVGHFVMMEDPARFNPILEAAIGRLARSPFRGAPAMSSRSSARSSDAMLTSMGNSIHFATSPPR